MDQSCELVCVFSLADGFSQEWENIIIKIIKSDCYFSSHMPYWDALARLATGLTPDQLTQWIPSCCINLGPETHTHLAGASRGYKTLGVILKGTLQPVS